MTKLFLVGLLCISSSATVASCSRHEVDRSVPNSSFLNEFGLQNHGDLIAKTVKSGSSVELLELDLFAQSKIADRLKLASVEALSESDRSHPRQIVKAHAGELWSEEMERGDAKAGGIDFDGNYWAIVVSPSNPKRALLLRLRL